LNRQIDFLNTVLDDKEVIEWIRWLHPEGRLKAIITAVRTISVSDEEMQKASTLPLLLHSCEVQRPRTLEERLSARMFSSLKNEDRAAGIKRAYQGFQLRVRQTYQKAL